MNEIANTVKIRIDEQKNLNEEERKWINNNLDGDNINLEKFLDKLYLKKAYLDETGGDVAGINKMISITRTAIYEHCLFEPNKDKLKYVFQFINSLISRKSGLDRVHLFTLNYDLLIENCADQLEILLNDGFDGTSERFLNTEEDEIKIVNKS